MERELNRDNVIHCMCSLSEKSELYKIEYGSRNMHLCVNFSHFHIFLQKHGANLYQIWCIASLVKIIFR